MLFFINFGMNKFDGLDIIKSDNEVGGSNKALNTGTNKETVLTENQGVVESKEKVSKKNFFGVIASLVFCAVVAVMALFNIASIKTFLQSEYDYSKKDIVVVSVGFNNVMPTSLTIKMPFANGANETAGEVILTPYDMCAVRAGVVGVVTDVSTESDNRSISIKLQNGCVVKYSDLAYVGVKAGFAVGEYSPIGFAEESVTVSAYLGDIRLPLTIGASGDIVWQN